MQIIAAQAAAVIREGAAVDFEYERILPGRVEVGRLDDPALDLAPVFRGLVPDFFDLAERLAREQTFVDRSNGPGMRVTVRSGDDVRG